MTRVVVVESRAGEVTVLVRVTAEAVSYTHLTLPTSDLV